MKRFRLIVLCGLLLASKAVVPTIAADPAASRVDVFYFHRTFRCTGCLNMEAYAAEATERLTAEREAGRLLFRAINLDEESDKHFAKDYALEFSSVVLSRRVHGQEAAWTNLPAAWELVGDKQNFVAYVETEIAKQLEQLPKE